MPIKLTPIQKEVLGYLLTGMTSEEVGDAMGISMRTVEYHRANIIKRLNARSAIHLGHLATLAGIEPAKTD